MYTIKQIFDRAISILLPMRCVLCGEAVAYDDLWCGKCELPYACDIRLPVWSGLDSASSPLFYKGKVIGAVLRLKRKPDMRTARFFAELMCEKVKTELQKDFDMLIPIPISREKLSERGFNQAETLARELGGLMGMDGNIVCDILLRNNRAAPQHKLMARERFENAKRSYSMLAEWSETVRGRKILLVDDVYTTGATLSACALLLKGAGAAGVSAVTATYTEPPEFLSAKKER